MAATAGYYYVDTPAGTITCRARGLFRKLEITPLVGDIARVTVTGDDTGIIVGINERSNFLLRPAIANVDRIILVVAAAQPDANLFVIDNLIAIATHKNIDTALVITKKDLNLQQAQRLVHLYRDAGYESVGISALSGDADAVIPLIEGRICVLAGNTGTGKTTLLNLISPNLELKTGEISKKLGRGRHTTRTVELYAVLGGLVADTPGFSSLEFDRQPIARQQLQYCFKEFLPFIGKCRFTGCSHTSEKGCAVLKALENGKIAPSRHESYTAMYRQSESVREWERRGR